MQLGAALPPTPSRSLTLGVSGCHCGCEIPETTNFGWLKHVETCETMLKPIQSSLKSYKQWDFLTSYQLVQDLSKNHKMGCLGGRMGWDAWGGCQWDDSESIQWILNAASGMFNAISGFNRGCPCADASYIRGGRKTQQRVDTLRDVRIHQKGICWAPSSHSACLGCNKQMSK